MIWSVAWVLLALLPVAAVIYIIHTYRKGSAARAAASSDRFTRIFETAEGGAPRADAAPAAVPAPATAAARPSRGTGSYARRMQMFTAQQVQLRELLRRGLPDHEVLSSVSLAAVIEVCGLPEGREREQRWRALAQQTVDCVVCSNEHAVVAVVDLDSGSTAETRFKSECLKAAGVRYLRWSPLERPRNDEIRVLILGG